jgi:hypothetical protein
MENAPESKENGSNSGLFDLRHFGRSLVIGVFFVRFQRKVLR